MMKKSITLITFLLTQPLLALDFQQDIVAKLNKLIISKSKGPSYGNKLVAHVEDYLSDTEYYRSLEDGENHDAMEYCEPQSVYEVIDVEDQTEYGNYSFSFESIKKKKKGKSIAYAVNVDFDFSFEYEVYKSKEDSLKDKVSKLNVECGITLSESFIFKNTKNKKVKFLGIIEQ